MTNFYSVPKTAKRKARICRRKALLVISALCAVAMVISDVVSVPLRSLTPVSDMVAPAMVILMNPHGAGTCYRNTGIFPFLAAGIALSVSAVRVVSAICHFHGGIAFVYCTVPAVLSILMFLFILMTRNEDRRLLPSVWLSAAFVLLVASLYGRASRLDLYYIVFLASSALVFYAAVLSMGVRQAIRESASARTGGPVSPGGGSRAGSPPEELFCRVRKFFEEERPYLDENITVGEVARRLYTNKVYISRAINDNTGKNFCQYVNHYRIMYSIEIFKENPHLRVSELAEMSGFHTLVSYNMAFRLVMNESPGEWCRRTRLVSSGREDLPDE